MRGAETLHRLLTESTLSYNSAVAENYQLTIAHT